MAAVKDLMMRVHWILDYVGEQDPKRLKRMMNVRMRLEKKLEKEWKKRDKSNY